VAHVIKEFTDTRPLPSPALLSTPPSPPPLLLIPTIVTCFDYQPLPLLLPIPSLFLLGHMLGAKLKFATNLILIANQYQVIESASSFALHDYEQPTKISDKIAQTTPTMGYKLMIEIN